MGKTKKLRRTKTKGASNYPPHFITVKGVEYHLVGSFHNTRYGANNEAEKELRMWGIKAIVKKHTNTHGHSYFVIYADRDYP